MFGGVDETDDAEVVRWTAGARDSAGRPFPIPAAVYEKIRVERARPLLAMALWDVKTANDPSSLAIVHTITAAFLEANLD